MDDVVILLNGERAYRKARKRLFRVLRQLRLQISPHKTRMGSITPGFHFLGVDFEVARTPQRQSQVKATVHRRTCRRALDRVKAMRKDAVDSAKIQRYLIRWATWWSAVVVRSKQTLIKQWVKQLALEARADGFDMCVGRGVLLFTGCAEGCPSGRSDAVKR